MKYTIGFFTVLFLASGCSQPEKKKTFEGIITYSVTLVTKSENTEYNNYQKQKYGETEKLYIASNGDFKREFPGSGTKGFDFNIYNHEMNTCLSKWRNKDTVYSSDCGINSLNLVSESELPDETINGELCKGYRISAVEPKSGQAVILTYFCPANKEYIDPALYKNFKDGFYNLINEKMNAPFYKLVMEMGRYSVTFDMTSIEPQDVNSDVFKLPSNTPVK